VLVSARRFAAVALGSGLALAGCHTYAPRPLDAAAHRQAWLARSHADEGLAAFARRLAESEAGEATGFDPSDGVSLGEGEVITLFFNPDLRLARLRAELAGATAEHAGKWEDPLLGVDAERILSSVDDPWVVGGTVGITIPISGRLKVEKAVANAAQHAELQRLAATEWSTRLSLRAAWLEWTAQTLRAGQARELSGRLERILSIVSEMERVGELSQIEARLFRIEGATRESALRAMDARTRQLELGLRALMGLSPRAPLPLVPASFASADTTSVRSLEALEDRNPGLAVLRHEYNVAEESLRLEIRKQYPDITIGPGFGTDEGDERFLLGVSLPLPLWNRNQQAIAEARIRREIARASFEGEMERLAGRIEAAQAEGDAARAARESLEHVIVPMVEEQDSQARRVAELGEVDTLLLLETVTRLHDTKAALIDARLAEALAAARLQELLGPPQVSPPAGAGVPAPDSKATDQTGARP
jgi:cobalt-zinc-cadmium efflux system outer membrane protein